MNTFILKEKEPTLLNKELNDFMSKQKVTYLARPNAIIIDGETLAVV